MDPILFIQTVIAMALFGHGFTTLVQDTTFLSKIAWPILRFVVPDGREYKGYQEWKDESSLDDRLSRHLLPDLLACPFCLSFWGAAAAGVWLADMGAMTLVLAALAAAGLSASARRMITSLPN